ncbi:MAG: hypothetical protein IPK83_05415 [Planctomycetes bacterium]|nr:hypothetical protein [Planctomycetota bacterium]
MTLACIISACLFHVCSLPANGHAILLSRGTVVAHPDRVTAVIEVSSEDFVHYHHLQTKGDTVAAVDVREAIELHRAYLLERFSIRDGRGDRLSGRVLAVRFDLPDGERIGFLELRKILVTYTIDYAVRESPRFITLQQRFGDDTTAVPSQLVLSVRSADSPSGRMIQLTSGGNFETVDLQRCDAARVDGSSQVAEGETSGERAFVMGAGRFNEIVGVVKRDPAGCIVDVFIPLTLLETFMPVPRSEVDFLSATEITTQCAALKAYFSDKPPAVFLRQGGVETESTIERVAFLAPWQWRMEDVAAAPRRLGAWSSRIVVRVRCDAPDVAELDWRLLNAAVMNATLQQVVNGNPCREEPVFTGDTRVALRTL